MAVRLVTLELCDDCSFHDIPDVPAIAEHVLAVDGDKLRKVQLCARCDLIWEPFIAVYQKNGQDIPEPSRPSSTAPKQTHRASQPEHEEEVDYRTAEIICPLQHNREGGLPQRILVGNRGGHCKDVHDGLKMWQVVWGDPDRVLSAPCRAHAQCITVGLSFISKKGLGQHMRNCDLPRIDQGDDPADMRQEGATQKSDDSAP